MHTAALDQITFVLCRPKFPENIGSAARAMKNMGLSRLAVVAPANLDMDKVRMMSTHAAADVVEAMTVYPDVETAVQDMGYVVGTTARLGRNRKRSLFTPPELAKELIPISQKNQVAVLFGPEDRGLENTDLRLCHAFVNIPTASFSSLNLSQAVMVIGYELFSTTLPAMPDATPKLANRYELDGLYEHLKEILIKIDFMKPDNPDYWLDNFRHMLSRFPLRSREVQILRGVCRQVEWFGRNQTKASPFASFQEETEDDPS